MPLTGWTILRYVLCLSFFFACLPVRFVVNVKYITIVEHYFQASLQSEDYGRHLLDVEDLLHKHSLIEADIAAQEDRIRVADEQANLFLEMESEVEGRE